MCVGNFKLLMLINWICHTKSESDLFLPEYFKTNVLNRFSRICSLMLSIHKDYCVFKNLVWNVHIKYMCIPESFNTVTRFSNTKITFANSQHENTNSKGDFVLKTGFKCFFFFFWYKDTNLSQTYLLIS